MSEMKRNLVVLGGGGHAAVVAESARAAGWDVLGFLDDAVDSAPPIEGLERLGSITSDALAGVPKDALIHAAVGDGALRAQWMELFIEREAAAIIDPSAIVSPSAHLEAGVFIAPGAVVNARTTLAAGVIINTGAIIEHDGIIGDFAHIAPGAVLCGGVQVGEQALIGAGATVLPQVRIGSGAVVGAGAVCVQDVPAGLTVAGSPARQVG